MIVGSIYLIFKLAKIGKKLGSLCQKMAKIQEKSKKTQKNQLNIAKKWLKYQLNHQIYTPIRTTSQTQYWIPDNMPKKQAKWPKMANNAIKQLQKCKKLGKNHKKNWPKVKPKICSNWIPLFNATQRSIQI